MLKIKSLLYDHDSLPQESAMIDELIDRILILWAIISSMSLIFSLIRSLDIGWSHRDVTQITIISLNILVAIHRQKYSTNQKALFLITVNLCLGIIGILTLGMFAAGIFFLPVASVIIALLYPKQVMLFFSTLSMVFMAYVGYGFTVGQLHLPVSAESLITNARHWTFYIFCMGFFFFITCSTILSYRNIVEKLLTEVKKQRDQLELLANSDQLTGLYSVRRFQERLEYCCQRCTRYKSSFALLFLDLDDFKKVNDSLGHDIGDHCLITTANRLVNTLRQTDTVCRIGGDEFVIILEDIKDPSAIAATSQKLLNAVSQPITIDKHTFQIGCSVGIALYPDHSADIPTLKKMADNAMYAAKAAGKNKFIIADPLSVSTNAGTRQSQAAKELV
ncbi:GGDEF domain-containing protein [Photobacterium sp. SDRW27]|uniref:GGDEF domain-containing protein n=1 Tax=Photobacterium obscurum TaxID=2829490 RepID=UPI0022448EE4|nr:GGDEF domain-containing protein [Photobacterium obscurum]MCW8331427.1 GGDEF domain-containing protein [Photobacterium obscurum]